MRVRGAGRRVSGEREAGAGGGRSGLVPGDTWDFERRVRLLRPAVRLRHRGVRGKEEPGAELVFLVASSLPPAPASEGLRRSQKSGLGREGVRGLTPGLRSLWPERGVMPSQGVASWVGSERRPHSSVLSPAAAQRRLCVSGSEASETRSVFCFVHPHGGHFAIDI